SVTNLSNSTQLYDLYGTLVGASLAGATTMNGSGGASVSDQSSATRFGGAGAVLQTTGAGTALYQGLVDGNPVLQLMQDPHSVVAGPDGSNTEKAAAGPLPGPSVTSSIQIHHRFMLSPGDSAAFTSVF